MSLTNRFCGRLGFGRGLVDRPGFKPTLPVAGWPGELQLSHSFIPRVRLGSSMIRRSPEPYAPTILIVDDDPQIRGLCAGILEEVGYFVREAGTGKQALAATETTFFDLVLLDLSMPDTDGFQLLRALRNELPQLKAIVMSGFMLGTLPAAVRRHGTTATLAKPFTPKSLLTLVCQVLAEDD